MLPSRLTGVLLLAALCTVEDRERERAFDKKHASLCVQMPQHAHEETTQEPVWCGTTCSVMVYDASLLK